MMVLMKADSRDMRKVEQRAASTDLWRVGSRVE